MKRLKPFRRDFEERSLHLEPMEADIEVVGDKGIRIKLLGRALEERGIPVRLLNLEAATDITLPLGENVLKVLRAFKLIKRTRKKTTS